ncbi:MAG: inositol-3-phosphate synthase [Thermoplasmatota archaeon]
MEPIRVALVGVGNCATSLVQGVEYYRNAENGARIPGLMNTVLGGYRPRDIQFVCAFDIDERKVGKDISEAILAAPNCAVKICDVPKLNAPVYLGPIHDGLSSSMEGREANKRFLPAKGKPSDVTAMLKKHGVQVVVLYLPVGSQKAVEFYAQAAMDAGCAVINCLPVFLASDPSWAAKFTKAGLPVLGDDIKSQVGATIVHRVLTRLFEDRGVQLKNTYQLNVGGNTDFLNMLDHSRLATKKTSKTRAVTSQLDNAISADSVHIGPSDYVPWLKDNKLCFLRMEGAGFGDIPLEIELRLSVQDSPNSAGVVIDAVRCAKLALDAGLAGPITGPSSYFFKHPPVQYADSECLEQTKAFIAQNEVFSKAKNGHVKNGHAKNGHSKANGKAKNGVKNGKHGAKPKAIVVPR